MFVNRVKLIFCKLYSVDAEIIKKTKECELDLRGLYNKDSIDVTLCF